MVLMLTCLFIAVAVFFVMAVRAFGLISRKHSYTHAYEAMYVGTVISAVCYFFPFYCDYFSSDTIADFIKSFFLSIHHAIRLFLVDVSYEEIRVFASDFGLFGDFYTGFGIVLFLAAPALTVTVLVSLLQKAFLGLRIAINPRKDYYVFSEFNLQSFYLAEDIREKFPRANIVFLGIDKENKTEYEKIKSSTQHIYPSLLSADCFEINQLMAIYRKNVKFFIIGEDEEINSATVISILNTTPHKSTREIYVRLRQSDRLLDNLPTYKNTQVFRIEHVQSLVLHNLECLGTRLFEGAKRDADGNKVISLLVVGLGRTGSELVKNLSWFTQIEGYTTKIHVFEQDSLAIERFKHACPGFFGEFEADCNCEIIIHRDMIFGTPAFTHELSSLNDINFVFVALGSDQINVNAAFDIRKTLAKSDIYPPIQAILRNDEIGKLLSVSKNSYGVSYDIEFIGSYKDIYCLDFITDAKNRADVICSVSSWVEDDKIDEFLSHEDAYRQSKAAIMHRKLMVEMNITGENRARSWHRQWVNQRLSEGYLYGPRRNDLAKLHPSLVPYDQLPEIAKYQN